MKKVRIAFIGTGHPHSLVTMVSIKRMPEVFDLVGYVEPSPNYRHPEHVVAHDDPRSVFAGVPLLTLDEVLAMDDLDAVVIECEEENSTQYAQMFADKGVHIQLDKPGTCGTASFERLVNTCRDKGLVLHLGYMYRYNPLVQKAMELKNSGALGEIFSVEAHMSILYGSDMAKWIGKHKGGMTYYLGCHDIDLVLQFMGGLPTEVIPLNCSTGKFGFDSENYGFAVLKYPNGVSFIKSCCAEQGGFDRRQLVVCGSRGTVEIKPLEIYVEDTVLKARATVTVDGKTEVIESDPFDRYQGMLRGFASYVRGESENPYTYDYEMSLFRTVMKASGVE